MKSLTMYSENVLKGVPTKKQNKADGTLQRKRFQDNGGYLMKRRSMAQPWSCVHGGTSATLVALVEGRTLYTANVGDSSALLAMQGRRVEVSGGVGGSVQCAYVGRWSPVWMKSLGVVVEVWCPEDFFFLCVCGCFVSTSRSLLAPR